MLRYQLAEIDQSQQQLNRQYYKNSIVLLHMVTPTARECIRNTTYNNYVNTTYNNYVNTTYNNYVNTTYNNYVNTTYNIILIAIIMVHTHFIHCYIILCMQCGQNSTQTYVCAYVHTYMHKYLCMHKCSYTAHKSIHIFIPYVNVDTFAYAYQI